MAKGKKTGGRKQQPFVFETKENGCMECVSHTAKVHHRGHYASYVWMKGRKWLLHRYLYTQLFGEIPAGMVIRHKCDNGLCVNPEHLELGTHKQNSQDMVQRGRSRNGPRKIDEDQAEQIRDLIKHGIYTQKAIAKMYGLSETTITEIKQEKIWTPENLERRRRQAEGETAWN